MKNNDKDIQLTPLKTAELLAVKGGYKSLPRGSVVPMGKDHWEDFEIRFGDDDGGTKNSGGDGGKLIGSGIV